MQKEKFHISITPLLIENIESHLRYWQLQNKIGVKMTVEMLGLFVPYPYPLGAIFIFFNVPSLLSISLADSGFCTIALKLPVP